MTWTKSSLQTLSACLRQSILLIFPFWSGLDRTHIAGFFPVIDNTKSSRHSWAMSFLSFPSSLLAHFCFTSDFSAWTTMKQLDSWEKSLVLLYFYHQLLFASFLLLQAHSLLMLLEMFSLGSLKIEPGVGKCLDVRQQCFNEGVKLILKQKTISIFWTSWGSSNTSHKWSWYGEPRAQVLTELLQLD